MNEHVIQRAGWFVAAVLAAVLVAMVADVARGGPLDPPGPPSPTLPLAEPRIPISELPIVITTPGSYFLTRTFELEGPNNGITITTSNVTLDLNGFMVEGFGADDSGFTGIAVTGPQRNIVIRNGVVAAFTNGIDADAAVTSRIENVTVRSYSNTGVRIGGSSLLQDCVIDGGGIAGFGVMMNNRSVLRRCTVVGITAAAALARTYALIEHNQFVNNGTLPLRYAVEIADNDVVVRDNHFSGSSGRDIATISNKRAVIADNVVTACTSIVLGGGAFVFAPLQGQEHSNFTHSNGYCP